MAVTAVPVVAGDGLIQILDGAALVWECQYEDGDFSASNITKGQRAKQVFRDRGTTYAIRETDDQEIEFSFSCHLVYLRGDGTTAGIEEVIRRQGVWSAATSTLPASAGGGANGTYCLTVKLTLERNNFGHANDQVLTLKYCSLTMDFSEGNSAKISIKGTAYCYSNDYISVT